MEVEDGVQGAERLSAVQRYVLGDWRGRRGVEVWEVCRVGWKVEGAGGLLESDGWVVEVQKMEVGVWRGKD